MKNCSEVSELITLYIDDKLNSSERSKFEAHIKNCGSCRKELEEIMQVVNLCTSISEEELPDAFKAQLHKKLVDIDKTISGEKNGKVLFLNRRYLKIASSIAAIFLMAVIIRGVFGNNLFMGKYSSKSDMNGVRTEMAQSADAERNSKSLQAESSGETVQGILSMNGTGSDTADMANEEKEAGDEARSYKAADSQVSIPKHELKDIDIVIKTDNPKEYAVKIKQNAESYGALSQKSKFNDGYGGTEEPVARTTDTEDTVQLYLKIPNSNYDEFINLLKSELSASSDIDFSQMNIIDVTEAIEKSTAQLDELNLKISDLEANKDNSGSQDLDELKVQRDTIQTDIERMKSDSEYTIAAVKIIKR